MKREIFHISFSFIALLILFLSLMFVVQSVYAYENKNLGYSIQLPEGWTVDESISSNLGKVMFNPPNDYVDTDAFIGVTVQKSYGDTAIELMNSAKQNAIRVFDDVKILFDGTKVIADLDGYGIEFTYSQSGTEWRIAQFAYVENGKQYLISWGAISAKYSLALPDFESSLGTFIITLETSPSPLSSDTPIQSTTLTPFQFSIPVEDKEHTITANSNSNIFNLNFEPSLKEISFTTSGESGTAGLLSISIPAELMWGDFSVYKDSMLLSKNVDYTQTENETFCTFQITYTQSEHIFSIKATEAIPEFPSTIIVALTCIALLSGVIVFRKRKTK